MLRFSHTDCGSSPAKTSAMKRTLLAENKYHTLGSNQFALDYKYMYNAFQTETDCYEELDLNFY